MHAHLNPHESRASDIYTRFAGSLMTCPVIAILRGVKPDMVVDICEELIAIGIKVIEVPLNSPSPIRSIAAIKDTFGDQVICGAGTVTTAEQITEVKQAGGDIVLSPHLDVQIIDACINHKMVSLPGIATPTEAFTAIKAGSRYLKVFPASVLTTGFFTSLRAVLPDETSLIAVGGINPMNLRLWLNTGISGVGMGSELYHPDDSKLEFKQKVKQLHQVLLAHKNEQQVKT